MRAVLWRETTTLGLRGMGVRKWMLERELVEVEVDGGRVGVKLGRDSDEVARRTRVRGCAAVAPPRPPAQAGHGRGTRQSHDDVTPGAATAGCRSPRSGRGNRRCPAPGIRGTCGRR